MHGPGSCQRNERPAGAASGAGGAHHRGDDVQNERREHQKAGAAAEHRQQRFAVGQQAETDKADQEREFLTEEEAGADEEAGLPCGTGPDAGGAVRE